MSQTPKDWIDLSEAGMRLDLVRVPAGRGYYVIRNTPECAPEAGIAALRGVLKDLGFRSTSPDKGKVAGKVVYVLEAKVRDGGGLSPMPKDSEFLARIPGAKVVPFDADSHYVDMMAPEGFRLPPEILPRGLDPYEAAVHVVRSKFAADTARMEDGGDEPALRIAVNAAIAAVMGGSSPKGLAGIVGVRPDLMTKPLPTLSPGSTIADAMRTAIATLVREDMEPEVRARLDREPAAAPAGP